MKKKTTQPATARKKSRAPAHAKKATLPSENPSPAEADSREFERAAERCPYCERTDFVKRGVRKNKHQEVQLYVCRNPDCGRTFTSRTIKGKQFPWPVVLDAISYYNLGYTFPKVTEILFAKTGFAPKPETIATWYDEYTPLCRFERLRPYAMKILAAWRARNPKTEFAMVETVSLARRQLYRFRYHRPKLILTLEEYT